MSPSEDEQIPGIDEKAITTHGLNRIIDIIIDFTGEKITRKISEHRNQQIKGFDVFIKAQLKQYSKIKNILYFNESVDIDSLYVPLFFSTERYYGEEIEGKGRLSDSAIFKKIEKGEKLIISATAGAGKSFFLRRALQKISIEGRIPIFFELRNLNGKPRRSIIDAIAEHVRTSIPSLLSGQIALGLTKGLFTLYLDGYDEIDPELSDHYETEILQLAANSPNSAIVISTRPIDTVLAWSKFSVYYISPLRKSSAIDLVERLQFDEGVKRKFIEAIEKGLYERHRSFFSIPLLVTMMLITFSETGEIEHKVTAFYNDAFHALLVRHDAKKEAFRRKLICELSRESFTQVFSAFCMITYLQSKFQFSEEDIRSAITEVSRLSDLDLDPHKVFRDFCVTSCMLIREGRHYVFSHRSFQEYFSAVFLSKCPEDIAKQILRRVGERAPYDNVMKMLLELNPALIEKNWILPKISKINREISSVSNRIVDFADKIFNVQVSNLKDNNGPDGRIFGVSLKRGMGHELAILGNLYGFQPYEILSEEIVSILSQKTEKLEFGTYRIRYLVRPNNISPNDEKAQKLFKSLKNIENAIRKNQAKNHMRLEELIKNSKPKVNRPTATNSRRSAGSKK